MSDEGTNKKVAKKITYYVENTVRRVGTRLHRARSATRHRFKIFLAGQRILRNKKLPLTEAIYQANEERIKELMLAGKAALHMPDGTRINVLPDGRLVQRGANGAITIVEAGTAVPEKKDQPAPEVKPGPETVEEPKYDDLTTLPSIGASRASKLAAAGLVTFAAIAKAKPAALVGALGVTEEVALDVIEAAKKAG